MFSGADNHSFDSSHDATRRAAVKRATEAILLREGFWVLPLRSPPLALRMTSSRCFFVIIIVNSSKTTSNETSSPEPVPNRHTKRNPDLGNAGGNKPPMIRQITRLPGPFIDLIKWPPNGRARDICPAADSQSLSVFSSINRLFFGFLLNFL